MSDQIFETRLRAGIGRYADGGVRPIDAHAIAVATVATGGSSGVGGRPWDRWIGRVRVTPRLVLVTALVLLAIAVAVTAVGLATRRTPELTDRAQPTAQPIPSTRPVASAPAEAPSSARIAFVQDGDVYVAAADGSSPVKALDDPGIDFTDVRWLSDGRHVVVGGVGLLTVVDLTTGERRRLDIPPGAETAWKPASDEVLASVGATLEEPAKLLVIDALTGARRELPAGKRALGLAWSADGSRLGGVVGSDFVWIDPDTGSRTVVASATAIGDPAQVAWSTGLERIAFVVSPDIPCEMTTKTCPSASEVYVVDAAAAAVPVKVAGPLPQGQLNGDNSTELFGPPPTPAWSPDGTWIAYRTAAGLTVIHPDGAGERELPIGHVAAFTWDADGAGISAIVTDAIDGTAGDEVHVDLATGATRASGLAGVTRVSPVSVGPSIDRAWDTAAEPSATDPVVVPAAPASAPSMAPTSHRLLVQAWHEPCGASAVEIDLDTGADRRIGACGVKVAADGRHLVDDQAAIDLLTGTSVPVNGAHEISPRGRWLITPPVLADYSDQVAAADSTWEVATWDGTVRARIPRPWVNPAYGPYFPSWSPDDSVVTVQQEHGRIRVDLTTGEQVMLTGRQGIWASSGDGRRIAFIRDGDAWIANADGSGAQNVSQFPFGGADQVDLLPDGQTFAVLQGQLMWVIRPDGTRRSIDLGPVADEFTRTVSWSPDGGWFAATQSSEADGVLGSTRFYSIDGVGLADVEGSDLVWSPDGRHAAVSVNPWNIKPVHTTAPTRQPPGRMVLVDRSGRSTKVANAWGAVWSPDSTRLTVTSSRKGRDRLDLLAADGTDRRTITTEHTGYVTWIPDR